MPLHADNPVFMRLVLDRFDHSVGGERSDAQAVTQIPNGLVMRGIDLDVESAVTFCEAGSGRELSELAAWSDSRGMDGISRIRRETFFAVFDAGVQFAGDVLVERASEADVQALAAITNGEDRFPGGEGVLENCEIGFFPVRIGVVRLFMARGAVKRRIHVRRAPGKNEGVQVLDLCGKIICRKLERQRNGFALGGGDCVDVILELVGNSVGLFVGGAPGDAHTWPGGGAQLGISRGHGTPNRSIRKGGGQPVGR
jgi:hypothetical protein